jgi:hypothetical protein
MVSRKLALRFCCLLLLMLCPFLLSGCWLFAAEEEMKGEKIPAVYTGLPDKSLAIVIYADQATTDEFTDNRKEVASFISAQFREHMPSVRLLNPLEVINWQDDTLNWFGLSEKDIGKHFSVERVLYIELLEYSNHMGGGYGDMQGHIKANCKIIEVDAHGDAPVWSSVLEVRYPQDGPATATKSDETNIRARTLQIFATDLVHNFYDWQKFKGIDKDR